MSSRVLYRPTDARAVAARLKTFPEDNDAPFDGARFGAATAVLRQPVNCACSSLTDEPVSEFSWTKVQ